MSLAISPSHPALLRAVVCVGLLVSGCGETPPPAPVAASKSLSDSISAEELSLFFAVVRSHPKQLVPEFRQTDENTAVDDSLTGPRLAEESRARLRRLFDPQIQGASLARDSQWSGLLRQHQVDPVDFASLVLRLSAAVTRHQLAERHNLARVSQLAEARIAAVVKSIEQTDATPPAQWTNDLTFARTRAVVQLGQAAALAEFTRLLDSVPAETRDLVARHFPELEPLIPPESGARAFDDLAKIAGEWTDEPARTAAEEAATRR